VQHRGLRQPGEGGGTPSQKGRGLKKGVRDTRQESVALRASVVDRRAQHNQMGRFQVPFRTLPCATAATVDPDALPAHRRLLPFVYQSTGGQTRFSDWLDPEPVRLPFSPARVAGPYWLQHG
jgi:hypothetical protein